MFNRYCRSLILCSTVTIFLAACAIHPDTQDYARDHAQDIIKKVRCEVRDAIIANFGNDQSYIMRTGLAFEFDFNMAENNKAGAGANFLFPATIAPLKLALSGGIDKTRRSRQTIKFGDTFAELAVITDCDAAVVRANRLYPMTGETGIRSIIDTFAAIVVHQPGNEISEFKDVVTFTTKLSGGIQPSITFAPGRTLTSLSANLDVWREDAHGVTILIDPPESEAQKAERLAIEAIVAKKAEAKLRFERSIPQAILLVGPDGKPTDLARIAPGAGKDGTPTSPPQRGAQPSAPAVRVAPRSNVPVMTPFDVKRRALEKLERSQSLELKRDLRDLLQR